MMHGLWLLFAAGLCLLLGVEPVLAQLPPERETGQEIMLTGREVVERLVRVEEGQKTLATQLESLGAALNQRIDDTNKRIEDTNKRIEDTNKRIDDLRADMNSRFADLRTELNARFAEVMTLLQIIISALIALVLAIAGAGFVMWRKILAVDAAVQTKIGLDEVVREQVGRLERDVGFLQGKVKELGEALEKK